MAPLQNTNQDPDADVVEGEPVESSESVALDRLPAAIREYLNNSGSLEPEDPEDVQRRIAERILSADTPEGVLGPQGTSSWGSMVDRPLVVMSFRWRESDLSEGAGAYAVVEAVDPDTGEQLVLTTGAYGVLVQLYQLWKLGALPAKLVLKLNAKATARGYRPAYLAAVTD